MQPDNLQLTVGERCNKKSSSKDEEAYSTYAW
jgi:hypothetical protein